MSTVADAAWENLQHTKEFWEQMPPNSEALSERFIRQVVNGFDGRYDEPLTLAVMVESKLAGQRFFLEDGNLEELAGLAGGTADMMRGALGMAIEMMEQMASSIPEMLKAQGLTEEQVLLDDSTEFSEAAKAKVRDGSLTIGEAFSLSAAAMVKAR